MNTISPDHEDFLEDMLDRSYAAIEYDRLVLAELNQGGGFEQALAIANAKCPDEAWLLLHEGDLCRLKKHYVLLSQSDG